MKPQKMTSWDTISAFEEFDPVFEETLVRKMSQWPVQMDARVTIPISQREVYGGLEIQAELPGVNPEDVFITRDGVHLKIQGVLRQPEGEAPPDSYHKPREAARFYRAIALPAGLDETAIFTCFENGVLVIRLEQ
jgi:HSP20 family protein